MFVLFDMVIHNPTHPETESDLALLDTLSGYFSRYDYATGGSVPCSLFSGFAHIANQFVRDQESRPVLTEAEESGIQSTTQGSQGVGFASRRTYLSGSVNFVLLSATSLNMKLISRRSITSRRHNPGQQSLPTGVSTWDRIIVILSAG